MCYNEPIKLKKESIMENINHMDTTYIKKNAVLNAFKAVTKHTDNRPVLQCICFSKDGYTAATDSHVLLKVDETHDKTDHDFLYNLQTGLPAAGNYPGVDRLIPEDSGVHAVISAKNLAGLSAWLKPLKESNVTLTFDDGVTLITDNGSYTVPSELSREDLLKDFKLTVNASYLNIAVTLFNALKASPVISFSEGLNNSSPFTVTYNQFTFLICPVRVPK